MIAARTQLLWRLLCVSFAAFGLITGAANAQQASRPVGDPRDKELREEWDWHTQYRADNLRVRALPRRPTIVFMGDSITEGWPQQTPSFFVAGRIGRGISGETTAQMLTRFQQDVIDLKPRVVHIMAGTNDIAGLVALISPEETEANIRSMLELAKAHGIGVILASIPPADHFSWRQGLETASKIRALNRWLSAYAKTSGAVYVDYWSVLHDGDAMRKSFTADGVHPNEAGYKTMAPIANEAIRAALRR